MLSQNLRDSLDIYRRLSEYIYVFLSSLDGIIIEIAIKRCKTFLMLVVIINELHTKDRD